MVAWSVLVIVLALVVYGLERNHRRQPRNAAELVGSSDVADRDIERLAVDLRAIAAGDRRATPTPSRAWRGTCPTGPACRPATR